MSRVTSVNYSCLNSADISCKLSSVRIRNHLCTGLELAGVISQQILNEKLRAIYIKNMECEVD